MSESKPQKLSAWKWIKGLIGFLVVVVAAIALGLFLRSRMYGPMPATEEFFGGNVLGVFLLGVFLVVVGACGYLLILATRCFTFDFQKPFMPSLSGKIRTLNLTVIFIIQGGMAFMMAPFAAMVLGKFLPGNIVVPASVLLPFFLSQLFFIWFQAWTPLTLSMIRQRSRVLGITEQQIA